MSKPLAIGLLAQGGRGWLGGFEYIKNLAVALGSLPPEARSNFRLSLISQEPLGQADQAQVALAVNEVLSLEKDLASRTFRNRVKWKLRKKLFGEGDPRFSEFLRQRSFDFVYPYLSAPKDRARCQFASWIPDFQHKHLPEFFSPAEVSVRNELFERTARLSSLVVLSSHSARHDFERFFPFAQHKARVLSFRTPASDQWFHQDPIQVQKEYNLPDKFFLVANQFWKHKNHLLVLQALKLLFARGICPTVVFTGNIHDYRAPEHADRILQSVHRFGIHRQIVLLGIVPRAHYTQLLRRCVAVVQPSLFEGWSTIVEDARAIGKPLLLSDLDVHREQNAPHATFFARHSGEDLASGMETLWASLEPGPDLAAERIARQNNPADLGRVGTQFLQIAREACETKNSTYAPR